MGYFDFDWDHQYPNGYPEKDDTIIENKQAKILMADYNYIDEKLLNPMAKQIAEQKSLTQEEWFEELIQKKKHRVIFTVHMVR